MEPAAKRSKEDDKVPTISLGTMEMGRRKIDQKLAQEMVEFFVREGYRELDTALMYCEGKTEEILGNFPAELKAKVSISTKANPWASNNLSEEGVLKQFNTSHASLQQAPVDIYYLHAPDHKTPIESTLKAIDRLHKGGKFKRFGLSNYAAWQVAEIYYICKHNGYVLPTVYQGMYNAITREVDRELFPCLRRLGIAFYAYNPLAGGLLAGKYSYDDLKSEPEGRFFSGSWAGIYRDRYWKQANFEALDAIKRVLIETYGQGEERVSMVDASLRWMLHHSLLTQNDAVIIGVSSQEHLAANIRACKQGPLHPKVVEAFEAAWAVCKPHCPQYFR